MPVRVLVVDDSATMRQLVCEQLMSDRDIEVVGTARNAAEARTAIKELNPDVMTLDVEMPDMDGLSFLEKVMRLRPMPVIMVSTLTARGSDTAIEALALGAVDCVVKPTAEDRGSFDELPAKVKMASRVTCMARALAPARSQPAAAYQPGNWVVTIGSSTGGVEALIRILTTFPANCPPTLITQHMPPHFTASFAARLDRLCQPAVAEARMGAPLFPGHIYIAPGGDQHLELAGASRLTCLLRRGEPVNGHCPSVDALFNSAAKLAGSRAVGVILTGMGRDGAQGLLSMRQAGCLTIGQDEASSVVYGMPRAAHEIGAVGKQLRLDKIGPEIVAITALPQRGT